MGFDCTLHVIDETLIREKFVPRLLGRSDEPAAFDEREDAANLWEQVRQALRGEGEAGDSPGTVASFICQLAIAYCAAELPYHYERGFCLSLWDDQPDDLEEEVPSDFVGDPEALFGEVVEERPDLAHHFPTEITENYCPGFYIPAEKVPPLLEWVEETVAEYEPMAQRLFRGLLLVLKEAKRCGLGYWEGTEMPVPMATISPPEEDRPEGLEELPSPDGICIDFAGESGSMLVLNHGIGRPETYRTAFGDFSSWPPEFTFVRQYTMHAARSRGGRWATACRVEAGDNHVRVCESLEHWRELRPQTADERALIWADFVGERVVAVIGARQLPASEDDGPPEWLAKILGRPARVTKYDPAILLIEDEGRLVPLEALPPAEDTEDTPTHGVAHLNEGADVLFWKGNGYELRENGWEMTFPIDASWRSDIPLIPSGSDGLFYMHYVASEGRYTQTLNTARRGQAPVRHLSDYDLVMHLSPGPDDAIVVKLGANRRGDIGLVYFPGDRSYIRITPKLFPAEAPDNMGTLHWFEEASRFVATTPDRIWSVPIKQVLELPRHDAAGQKK